MDSVATTTSIRRERRPLRPAAAARNTTSSSSSRPAASAGRAGASPRLSGAGASIVSPSRNTSRNERNPDKSKIYIDMLKCPTMDLRSTGANPELEPTLELCLIMDCTGSMGPWIEKAKKTINEIIDKTIKECEEDGDLKCRVSFVGYRDISDSRRFEVKEFTADIDSVKNYISRIEASGGADLPEDMQGGLKVCLFQDWTEEAAKRAVLITDAPPHGK